MFASQVMVRVVLLVKGYVRTAEEQGQCERQLYRQQRSVMPGALAQCEKPCTWLWLHGCRGSVQDGLESRVHMEL